MARRKPDLVILVMLVFLGGCASGFKATYDHDPEQNFSTYQSFAWISAHPMKIGATAGAPNPLLEPRIMSAISDALIAKGYEKVDEAKSADFVLSFTIGSREKIKVDSYPTMAGGYGTYGRYPGHWGWGSSYYGVGTETTVRQYTQGMLAVDVFDVKERRPVWHGVATKSMHESDREDAAGTIKAAVDAVLAGFPPS